MEIRDSGVLDGPVLLFGGPYSNLQALRALMDWADANDIARENRICTGDVVAYCADPVGCIDLMQCKGGPVVAGNCEKELAVEAPDCSGDFAGRGTCARLAQDWYAYAARALDAGHRAWLGSAADRVLFRHHGQRYVVLHGGAGDISRFLWPISADDEFWHEISILQEEVGAFDAVISGHGGLPFQRNIDGISWINAGVIGLPANDGQRDTVFALLKEGELQFQNLRYDAEEAAFAMERAGLTQGYDEALQSGYWPSEEILPKSMRHSPRAPVGEAGGLSP